MSQLKTFQVIPDGVYRIKSAVQDTYLQFIQDGTYNVSPVASDPGSNMQKWQVKGNSPTDAVNTYVISNVGNNLQLSFREDKNQDGTTIYRLSAFDSGSNWTIEPRGDAYVIGWEGNQQCIDYADGGSTDAAILWDRNDLTNQRWILEPVPQVPTPKPAANQVAFVNATGQTIETFISYGNNTYGWSEMAPNAVWGPGGSFANPCCALFRLKGAAPGTPFTSLGQQVPLGSVSTIYGFRQPFYVYTP